MLNRLKTALARAVPYCRKPALENKAAAELTTLEIADRLDNVICELAVIDMAIAGGGARGYETSHTETNGLAFLLHRQMDEIATLRDAVHRPKAT